MTRKDRLDENERSGKESKSTGPVGAIARGAINTRAHSRRRYGGVPVVAIVVLVAIGVATLGLLVAPAVGETTSFEGEVVLEGTSSTSSTSWSYEVADLDGAEDLSVELTGARVTEDVSESGTLATDESYEIEPSGNAAPEDAVVEIEGVRDETPQSESVSDGSSIEVGGNVDPVEEQIKVEGTYSESYDSESGTLTSGDSSIPINVAGSLDPSDEQIDLTFNDIEQETEVGGTGLSIGDTVGETGSITLNSDQLDRIDEAYLRWDGNDNNGGTVGVKITIEGENMGDKDIPADQNGYYYWDEGTVDVSDKSSVTVTAEITDATSWDMDALQHSTSSVDQYIHELAPSDISVEDSTGSNSLGEGIHSLDLSDRSDLSVSGVGGSIDYTVDWTERSGAEDITVSVDGNTLSESGPIDGAETKLIDLPRGDHSVSVDYTGDLDDASIEWSQVDQTEDPVIDVAGETIYHPGLLGPGETVSETIDLSEGQSYLVERSGGTHDAAVSTSWTEVGETQNPTISVNGETTSYSGTLAEGSTTNLDVSEGWIVEGENTVDVDLDGTNGGPEPQVGVSYSHTATTVSVNETVNSTTWSEDVEVARTFASDQSGVELRVSMPDNVVGVAGIEEQRDGDGWSSVSSDRYELDGTDLEVSMGDVAAEEKIEVRAVGDKTRVLEGEIEVLEPTLEGNDLSTRMRVSHKPDGGPVSIEVTETAVGDRIHLVESAEWTSSEYQTSKASGTEILYLPDAVEDAEATIETAPLSIDPETGEAETSIDNRSEMRFSIEPGSTTGDDLEVGYYDTESGEWYELYSVTEERQMDIEQASSPVFFSTDDRESTYLISITDPPGGATIAGGSSGGGGLPPALLLLAGIAGVGGVGLVSQRFGLGRRVTIPAAIVATIGIAELSTPTSLLGTLSNDLIRSSSSSLIAALATVGTLGATWLVDRRTDQEIPRALYVAIGIGGSAWLATSALGDAGTSVAGLLVGGGVLVGLWAASRRWELPRSIVGIVGLAAVVFMLESILPGLLEELVVGPLSSGAREVAPLVVIGLLIVLVVWLRRRGDDEEIVLEVDND